MPSKISYTKQIIFYLFLIAYALLLAYLLFFKEVSLLELFDPDRTISRPLNLIPFQTILSYTHFNVWIALMNVVGNIVLFVPFGLYLQIFKRDKKVLRCVAIACAVSICVEAVQFCLGIGRADLDDVILNTLGGLLGALLYQALYWLLRDEGKTKTAVTVLFCVVSTGAVVCYLVIVYLLGFRVRIF